MKRVLRKGTQRFEVLDRSEVGLEQDPERLSDEFFAVRFVRGFMLDPLGMMTFREMLAKGVHHTDVSVLSDGEVLDEIANRIRTGQLRINRLPVPVSAASSAQAALEEEPAEESTEAPAEEPAAPVAVVDHWIKLEIVDEETGEPIEGVTLKIKLPTDEVKEFTSDGSGTIEVKGVPEGTWGIEEMIDPDALEVTEIS